MNMNRHFIAAGLAVALAVPAVAAAKPSTDHAKSGKAKKAKTVTFVFKGTFTAAGTVDAAAGTVDVVAGNAHARKGGFVGESVSFELADAKVVVADTNADGAVDVTDVKDGDRVVVHARLAKGTEYGAADEAVAARKLVDQTNAPVAEAESGA